MTVVVEEVGMVEEEEEVAGKLLSSRLCDGLLS
jgi:hypothetical protein